MHTYATHMHCAHIHYTQVYNETIRDLLVPSGPLDLREDTQKGLVVNKLTRYQVSRYDAYHWQGERTNYTFFRKSVIPFSFSYIECETMRKKDFSGERFDGQRSLPVCWLYNPLSSFLSFLPQPKTANEILSMLEIGNRNRTQHPTDANATSSRSHAVFQVSTIYGDLPWV